MAAKQTTFHSALERFLRSHDRFRKQGHAAALIALEHFGKTGDVVYIQEMLDAMTGHKIHGRASFVAWVGTFAPVKYDENTRKFSKNRAKSAPKLDLDGAKELNIFDAKADPEPKSMGMGEVFEAFDKLIERLQKNKKVKLMGNGPTALAKLTAAVREVEAELTEKSA